VSGAKIAAAAAADPTAKRIFSSVPLILKSFTIILLFAVNSYITQQKSESGYSAAGARMATQAQRVRVPLRSGHWDDSL